MTRGYVDDSLLPRQAVETVLASGIEAVVVDACWREFGQYERLWWIGRVVLPPTAI